MAIQRWERSLTPLSPEMLRLGKIIQLHISLLSTNWCWAQCQVKMISQFPVAWWHFLSWCHYYVEAWARQGSARYFNVWYRAFPRKYSLCSSFLFSHFYSKENLLLNFSCRNFSWMQYLLLWSLLIFSAMSYFSFD